MSKKMKKIIAAVISITFVLSSVGIVYAADTHEKTDTAENTVSISAENTINTSSSGKDETGISGKRGARPRQLFRRPQQCRVQRRFVRFHPQRSEMSDGAELLFQNQRKKHRTV